MITNYSILQHNLFFNHPVKHLANGDSTLASWMRNQPSNGTNISIYASIPINGFTVKSTYFLSHTWRTNNRSSSGIYSSMFTVTEKFFSIYRNVSYWQFQATYINSMKSSSATVQLKINHSPSVKWSLHIQQFSIK